MCGDSTPGWSDMTVKFTHLKLENWRNFREVDLPLRERMFVVGPNASGKTNLLDAFKFLRDIARAQGGLAAAVNSRGGFGKIRSLHAHGKDRHLSLEVTLQHADDTWTYALELSGRPSEPALVEHESVTRNGELVMERPNADDKKDRRLREQTHLE